MIKIEIKEADLRKALNDISKYDKGIQAAVKDQVAKTALLIQTEAKRRVPVRTGRLRSSINSQIVANGAIVGTNVEYAALVEYGSVKKAAKPFLFPAFEGERPKFLSAVAKILKKK